MKTGDMRLWSLHPRYLDARGLVAVWREGLLAQAVLRGRTTGYLHHPQLTRFRGHPSALAAIAEYLRVVHAEASARGYRFAAGRIGRARRPGSIAVTRGQLEHEWHHLMTKLAVRDAERHARLDLITRVQPHPLFRIVPGAVEPWEKVRAPPRQRSTFGRVLEGEPDELVGFELRQRGVGLR